MVTMYCVCMGVSDISQRSNKITFGRDKNKKRREDRCDLDLQLVIK